MAFRPRLALTVALALFLSVVPLSGAQGVPGLPAWGTEPSPNTGFERNAFEDVDVLTPTDAWAVGSYQLGGIHHPRPLVQRWNGKFWSSVAPSWSQEGELFDVAAVAPDDVWMVGGYQQGGEALIAHWNGTSLNVVPHPNPGEFNRLYAVTAIAADDVWAVGEFTNPISRTLALHWDGTSWTHVPTPNGSDGYNQLLGVSARASDDVWAVGEDGNETLSLHWDGTVWAQVPTPSPGFSASLRSVSASPTGDVWAVGDSGNDSLIIRWDGTQWNVVTSPSPSTNFLDLNDVASVSATDAWAAGVYDVSGEWKTLTMRWNGTQWALVDSPSPDPSLNALSGVAASGADVWTVGWGGGTGSLALRWTGGSWTRSPTPNEGVGNNVLNGISAAATNDIWAVGHAQNRSLTLHYDGSAWSIVPSPNQEHGVRLEGVVAIAHDDAWAVGWSGSPGSLDDRNVAMHWDGTSWSIVPTPQPGGASVDRLLAIDADGPNDVWATGIYWDSASYDRSVIMHWDGTAWTVVPHNCDTYWGLTGLTVLSASEAWAVGDSTTCHYDGTAWTEVPSPQPQIDHYEIAYPLEDVSAVTPTDVWAVGARILDGPFEIHWQAIAEHWDGKRWTLVRAVPAQALYGVEALATDNVWAVGSNGFGPVILRYDGAGWSTVPTPEWGRGGRLAGITSVGMPFAAPGIGRGSMELWSAGHVRSGTADRTLIQRLPSEREGAIVGGTNVSGATISWFGPENGSTETNVYGDYQVGGLQAGTYTFIATYAGCAPDSGPVTVLAGTTLARDFFIDCGRARPGGKAGRRR
jgi:hypothetical protein